MRHPRWRDGRPRSIRPKISFMFGRLASPEWLLARSEGVRQPSSVVESADFTCAMNAGITCIPSGVCSRESDMTNWLVELCYQGLLPDAELSHCSPPPRNCSHLSLQQALLREKSARAPNVGRFFNFCKVKLYGMHKDKASFLNLLLRNIQGGTSRRDPSSYSPIKPMYVCICLYIYIYACIPYSIVPTYLSSPS